MRRAPLSTGVRECDQRVHLLWSRQDAGVTIQNDHREWNEKWEGDVIEGKYAERLSKKEQNNNQMVLFSYVVRCWHNNGTRTLFMFIPDAYSMTIPIYRSVSITSISVMIFGCRIFYVKASKDHGQWSCLLLFVNTASIRPLLFFMYSLTCQLTLTRRTEISRPILFIRGVLSTDWRRISLIAT